MIYFPPLQIGRLSAQLTELSILQAIELAAIPDHLSESATTKFLNYAVKEAKGVKNPEKWTVQERMCVVGCYLSSVLDDGPDFSIGENHYLDYLDIGSDYVDDDSIAPIEHEGDTWRIRHLTGGMAESVERLYGQIPSISGKLHWMIGCMSAQLVRDGDTMPCESEEKGEFDKWLLNQINVLTAYPESDFISLLSQYLATRKQLYHLFDLHFSEDGLIAMPKEGATANQSQLPVRFPIRACITPTTQELGGAINLPGN